MSINALGIVNTDSLQQVDKESAATSAAAKGQQTASHQISSEDTTSFTSSQQTVQSLSQTALQTFPTRQVKVEALKQAVSSAQYQLDSAKIAQSLANSDV